MTEDHDEDSAPQSPGTGNGQRDHARPRLLVSMVAVLVLLVILGLASAAAGWWVSREPGAAQLQLRERAEVARAAEQFTVAVNNYDAESVESYKGTVSDLLSTKFKSEFDRAMEDIVVQVQEAQMSSEGTVLASGVASLDSDSARVLVVADATVKTVFNETKRHFRWEVSLVEVDGRWLVDDFSPVA